MINIDSSQSLILIVVFVFTFNVINLLYYPTEHYNLLHQFIAFIFSHKQRKLGKKANLHVIGHRGSKSDGLPENTIASFKDAIKQGAEIIELDVWLSKDNQVIVHHDPNFHRMTSNECLELVTAIDFKDYPPIVPIIGQCERVKEYPIIEYTRISLLKDVLKIIPAHVGLIVEVKQDSDVLIDQLIELIDAQGAGRIDNIYWFSLTESVNAKLRARKRYPTITSIIAMLKTLLLYYTGLLPFIDLSDDVFGITVTEITLEQVRHEKAVAGLPDIAKRLLAWILAGKPPYMMVAPKLFQYLRSKGVPVWFLGVNQEDELRLAVKTGASAILTDKVSYITSLISDQKLQFAKVHVA